MKSTQDLRRGNRLRVLLLLREHETLSRVELADATGLTEAAVSRITRELVQAGLVAEGAAAAAAGGRAGRPSVGLSLDPGGVHALGFDLGANSHALCLVDARGRVLARRSLKVPRPGRPRETLALAVRAGCALLDAAGVEPWRVVGTGVAIAGHVDRANRRLMESEPLQWHDVGVADELEAGLQLPATVETRPGALLFAERLHGAAQDMQNVLLVHAALGLGGAMLLDGRRVRGRSNTAGQLAHMPVPGSDLSCPCGRRGCLALLASGRAIVARLPGTRAPTTAAAEVKQLQAHLEAAARGEPAAARALAEAGRHMGRALDCLVPVLDVQRVVLAGMVGSQPDYVAGVRSQWSHARIDVVASGMPSDRAAAALALETFFYSTGFDFERLRQRTGQVQDPDPAAAHAARARAAGH